MANDSIKSKPDSEFELLKLLGFLVVVALFLLVGTKVGTRAVGVYMLMGAFVQYRKGSIPYGWEGLPPSGHISGWFATLLNLIYGALGLAFVIWPEVAMGILGWD